MRFFYNFRIGSTNSGKPPGLFYITGARRAQATNDDDLQGRDQHQAKGNQRWRAASISPLAASLRQAIRITSTLAMAATGVKKHAEKLEMESHASVELAIQNMTSKFTRTSTIQNGSLVPALPALENVNESQACQGSGSQRRNTSPKAGTTIPTIVKAFGQFKALHRFSCNASWC